MEGRYVIGIHHSRRGFVQNLPGILAGETVPEPRIDERAILVEHKAAVTLNILLC